MADEIIQPPATQDPPKFDPLAHMQSRNEADALRKAGKAPESKQPETKKEADLAIDPNKQQDGRRRSRRVENALRTEIGKLMGRIEMLETPKSEAKTEKVSADPEPQRGEFPDDASYNRALGRWDARQETAKVITETESKVESETRLEKLRTEVAEMDVKFSEDAKGFDDWDEVAELAGDMKLPDDPIFSMLIGLSDVRAKLFYHFVKEPKDLESIAKHAGEDVVLAREFARLERKVEKLYSTKEPKKKETVVQAVDKTKDDKSEEKSEERTHLAEDPASGRTVKPRPSAAVAAPAGGTPAADEPKPGTAAWMMKRNQEQYRR